MLLSQAINMAEQGKFLGIDLSQPIKRRKLLKTGAQLGVASVGLGLFGSQCGAESPEQKVAEIEKIFKEKTLTEKHAIIGDIKRVFDNQYVQFTWELKNSDNKEGETTSETNTILESRIRINLSENDNLEPYVEFKFDPVNYVKNNYSGSNPKDYEKEGPAYFIGKTLEDKSVIITIPRSKRFDYSYFR